MIIDCISDLHGHYPKLDGGDLLIIAGDLTSSDSGLEHLDFIKWLCEQKYEKKVFILGSHDNYVSFNDPVEDARGFSYLCDSGTEFGGLKIWGSPWTTKFPGINPHCCAFTVDTDKDLQKKYDLIPEDTDILITHNPPISVLDKTIDNKFVGSLSLSIQIGSLQNLKLHVFGHVHESYGKIDPAAYLPNFFDVTKHYSVNASHVNERYQPVNKPVRIIL